MRQQHDSEFECAESAGDFAGCLQLAPADCSTSGVVIGHVFRVPGYRAFLAVKGQPVPPRWVIWVAQIVVGIAIWQHYQSIFGEEAAGTMLTLLTCLKTYELRTKRDHFVCSMLCFLVLMSNMLLDQSLILTLYVVADVVLIFAFLYALESGSFSWSGVRGYLKPTGWLALKSVPVLVVCFILFPRFSTGFGNGANTVGKTGITDELKPGSISQLINSEEVVFRANFLSGEIPPRRSLYWRGAILDRSEGLNWTRDRVDERKIPAPAGPNKGEVEVYLEAGYEKFLFSTDSTRTVVIPNDFNRLRTVKRLGEIFELNQPLSNRERYLIQNGDDSESLLAKGDLERYLQLGEKPSAELLKLVRALKGSSTGASVSNVLAHFRGNGFEYSMQPPKASGIDEFLFKNRSGFCEHYAASTATLLRALGIPSRVVVGFQGARRVFLRITCPCGAKMPTLGSNILTTLSNVGAVLIRLRR